MPAVNIADDGARDYQSARARKPLHRSHRDKKLDARSEKYTNRANRVDYKRNRKRRFSPEFIAYRAY